MNARITLVLLCLVTYSAVAHADDGPAAGVPGLAELAHYVGEWDVRITSPNSGFASGQVSTKWILGGRFIEQTGTLTSADGTNQLEVRTLITYDVEQRKYHSWTFFSTGTMTSRTGTWDAAAHMFKFTGNDGGNTLVSQADFSEEDTETWKISMISEQGTEDVVISGVNTRRE